jgi:hypothetical protein
MSENNKNSYEENNRRNKMRKELEQEIAKEAVEKYQEFIEDLKTNPKYKEYFERFNYASVQNFIQAYALKKYAMLKYGESYLKNEEREFLQKKQKAERRLWEIQQKKLFNLQCLWRAEKIKIPEISVSYDFFYWEKNIENCPFLDPISEEDFDLYYEYILSDQFKEIDWIYSWQDYDRIKEEYHKEGGQIPEWYAFYDARRGTEDYLLMEDIRGNKEKFYLEVWHNYQMKKYGNIEAPDIYKRYDERPDLNIYDPYVVEDFIKRFESPKLLEYYRAYRRNVEEIQDPELDMALEILRNADEKVEIQANEDWREAVILAARNYQKRQIAIAHRQSYQNYLYRNIYQIAHEVHAEEFEIQWYKDLADQMKARIIEARVILGEPPNLDF